MRWWWMWKSDRSTLRGEFGVVDADIETIARSLTPKYGIRLNPVKVKSIRDIEMDNRAFYADVVEYGYVTKGLEYF